MKSGLTYLVCIFIAAVLSFIPVTISETQQAKKEQTEIIIVTETTEETMSQQPKKIYVGKNNAKACKTAYKKILKLIEQTEVEVEETEEEYLAAPETKFQPFTTYVYNGTRKKLPASEHLQRIVYDTAERYDLPYRIVLAMLGSETTWNENPDHVETNDDARYIGIGCINEKYHAVDMAKRGIDIYTLAGNVEGVCWLLKAQYDRFGTIELALMAYNGGAGHVQWALERGIYENGYTRTVMGYAESFE